MARTTTITHDVQGFHCRGCSDDLSKHLNNVDGVIRARTSFEDANVVVRFDADRASEQDLRDQVARSGFEAV
jgi:copper chaperone CopZ